MKSECIFVRGLLVRETCRRRGGQKNTTIWEGTMSVGAEVGTCCSERVADWQRKMSAARIDDRGPRIDFCFDLIIVTPGKRPPPVISPPPFACPTTGTSRVPREMYVQRTARSSLVRAIVDYYGIIFTMRSACAM